MYDFIEAMIKGHDNTPYKWVSDGCAETCTPCSINNDQIKPMNIWQAEGLPQTLGKSKYHECGDDCSCRLEKA